MTKILINNCTRIWRKNKKHVGLDACAEKAGAEAGNSDVEFRQLLLVLPEDSRTIFQLYFGEEFTTKEIAEILGMKENTVKSRIHRGKEQLRESLQEEKTPVQEVRRSAAGRPVRVDFAVCHKSRWAE